jgi:hypothetical protein
VNRGLLIALAVLFSPPAISQELGRLFFTPEQRNALDARRKARIPDKPAAVTIESPVTRVDGMVSRGGGKSTVWVNGEPVPDGSQPDGLRVRRSRSGTGSVTVDVGESDTRVDLKIGQSFDRATGEVRDSLEGGEVKINRRPAARPAR